MKCMGKLAFYFLTGFSILTMWGFGQDPPTEIDFEIGGPLGQGCNLGQGPGTSITRDDYRDLGVIFVETQAIGSINDQYWTIYGRRDDDPTISGCGNFCNNGSNFAATIYTPLTGTVPYQPWTIDFKYDQEIMGPNGIENIELGMVDHFSFRYSSDSDANDVVVRIYDGYGGTGNILKTLTLSGNAHPLPQRLCYYDTWSNRTISFDGVGRSVTFSGIPLRFLIDNLSWSRQQITEIEIDETALTDNVLLVPEGKGGPGTLLPVGLSDRPANGETIILEIVPDSGDADLAVFGSNVHTFNHSNGLQDYDFSFEAVEDDGDFEDGQGIFLIRRSQDTPGTSNAYVHPLRVTLQEVDDELVLDLQPKFASDGTTIPNSHLDLGPTFIDTDNVLSPGPGFAITAIPAAGKQFQGWTIDTLDPPELFFLLDETQIDGLTGAASTTLLAGDPGQAVIRAEFVPKLELTIESDPGGTTMPSGTILAVTNQPRSISATPDQGYRFVRWEGMHAQFGQAETAATTVSISQSTTIRAVFEASQVPQFVLDLDPPPGNPGTHLIQEGHHNGIRIKLSNDPEGTVHTRVRYLSGDGDLEIVGDSTLTFAGSNSGGVNLWHTYRSVSMLAREDDGDSQSDSAIFIVEATGGDSPFLDSNEIQSVSFFVQESDDDILLSVMSAGNGSTTPAGSLLVDSDGVNSELPFNIQATPDSGYRFDRWSGDTDHLANSSAQTQLNTNLDTTITAHFVEGSDSEYLITINHVGNGNTIPTGVTTVQAGDLLTINAIPAQGFRFAGWTGNVGDLIDASVAEQSFIPTQNASLIANFVDEGAETGRLTLQKTGMGTILPQHTVIIEKGVPFQIQATPAQDYEFRGWTASAGATFQAADQQITTIIIQADTLATAGFGEIGSTSVDLTVTHEGMGSTQPANTVEIPAGVPFPISATPGNGYRFVQWSGTTIGIDNAALENTNITISQDTQIRAVFELEGGGNRILLNGPLVMNEGQRGQFNLALLDPPSGPVTLSVQQTTGDPQIHFCDASSFTFNLNSDNYNSPIHKFDICVDILTQAVSKSFLITQTAGSGSDPLLDHPFTVMGEPGDSNGNPVFEVNPGSLLIDEGGSGTVTVRLSADPGSAFVNWEVTPRNEPGDDPNIRVISGASGTHGGSQPWDQSVTVSFQVDQDSDAEDGTAVFILKPTQGSQFEPPDAFITVSSVDDEGQNPPHPTIVFLVDQTPITLTEGESGLVGIKLSAKPESNIGLSITRHFGDPSITNDESTLSFTPNNWSLYKYVTVHANQDDTDLQDSLARFLIEQTSGLVLNISDAEFVVFATDNDYAIAMAVDSENHHGQTLPSAGTTAWGDSTGMQPHIQAVPDPGYLFSHWSGDIGLLDSPWNPTPVIQVTGPDPNPNTFALTAHFISEADIVADIANLNSLLDAFGFPISCVEGLDPSLLQHNSLGDPSQFLSDIGPDFNRAGPARILPHSGQEVLEHVDLTIKGRDHVTDLVIKRRHMTRRDVELSPFGPAWAFNYDHWFEQDDQGHIVMHSYGRQDFFQKDPASDKVWIGTGGRFGRLTYEDDDTALVRTFTGTKIKFQTSGSPGNVTGRISEIISPNGNQLRFTYQSGGQLFQKKLLHITDSFGRIINFLYEDVNFPQGVTRVVDNTHPDTPREVNYSYNPQGQLLSVTSPRVDQTVHNNFLTGKTTTYTYLNHPQLLHAITSVTAPNQNATNPPGPARLHWTYNTEPGNNPLFGFVTSHTVGDPSGLSGGTYHYHYEIPDPVTNPGPNDVAMQTTVTDRRGTQTLFEYNRTGQLLNERILAQFREDHDFYERSFRYNRDGDLTERKNPLLGTLSESHPDPLTTPRHMQANERTRVLLPDERGGDQETLHQEIIYEPIYNKPFKIIDPRGQDPHSGFPAQAVTTVYLYDYMEDLPGALTKFAPQLGLTSMELRDLFDQAGIRQYLASLGLPIHGGDLNDDQLTNQDCGNLIRVFHPSATLPDQAASLGLPLTQFASETYQYNAYGQVTLSLDAEENSNQYYYFPANDPDGDGVIDTPGADNLTGGYLSHIIRDSRSGPATQNSGSGASPVRQTTHYQYSAQKDGQFPANHRGIPTATIDGRGVKDIYLINALDQAVTTIRAYEIADDPTGDLAPFAYEYRTQYDHNNNVMLQFIPDRDGLNSQNNFIKSRTFFNILDQPVETILDPGPGNLKIKTRFKYDPSQNLIEKKSAPGKAEQAIENWFYDARDQLIRHTRGVAGADSEEASFEFSVDRDGNILQTTDNDGDVVTHVYDGYNRLVQSIDRLGHVAAFQYDAASNLINERRHGPLGVLDLTSDPHAQPHVLLAETAVHFDERGRQYRKDRRLFHYSGRELGPLHDGDLEPDDGLVTDLNILDRLGRTVALVDADADLVRFSYDGLSRQVSSLDPLQNQTDVTFDAMGNAIVISELEMDPDGGSQPYVSYAFYDALNRPEERVEPNGQSHRIHYDSRNNKTRTIDHLGNEVVWVYDRVNRLVEKRTFLKDGGENASSGDHDDLIAVQWQWDDLNRLVAQVDGNQAETVYQYDDLGRKIATLYPDGLSETWVFNGDSELQTHLHRNGYLETWLHDAKGRPIQLDIAAPGRQVHYGTSRKIWAYDGLDRKTLDFDDNAQHDLAQPTQNHILNTYWYDSLNRTINQIQALGEETQDPGSLGKAVSTHWQGRTRKVKTIYPNGREVNRHYDPLDRLMDINESANGQSITSFEYLGPNRLARMTHGNGTVLNKEDGYDQNRRHLNHYWRNAADEIIIGYQNQYNGAGGLGTNRRISESRTHATGATDIYQFDSAYRMIGFSRDDNPSHRELDSTDKMTSFVEESLDRAPILRGQGMNQYSGFDQEKRYNTSNGNLLGEGAFEYRFDYQNRLIAVTQLIGSSTFEVSRYLYAADGRRVLKRVGPLATRYLYDAWQVVEERDGMDAVLRQYVDGSGLDEHCQLKTLPLPDRQEPIQEGSLTSSSSHTFEMFNSPTLWQENELAGYFLELSGSSGNPRVYQITGNHSGKATSTPQGFPLFLETAEAMLPTTSASSSISYRILAPKGFEEVYYYHANSQGFVGGLSDRDGHLVETLDYRWLGSPTFNDAVGDPLFVEDLDPHNLYFQSSVESIETLGNGGVRVRGLPSGLLYEDGSLANFYLVLVPNQPPFIPQVYTIRDNHYGGHPQALSGFTWFHIEEDLIPSDFLGGTLAIFGPKGNQSTVGNLYAFQGRRLDPETGNYYFRHRYYSPESGEFLSFDPMGTWHHGQGNGYSAFDEDPWNNRDPMGLETNNQFRPPHLVVWELFMQGLETMEELTDRAYEHIGLGLEEESTYPSLLGLAQQQEAGLNGVQNRNEARRAARNLIEAGTLFTPSGPAAFRGCLRHIRRLIPRRPQLPGRIVVPSRTGRYMAIGNSTDTFPLEGTPRVSIIRYPHGEWTLDINRSDLLDSYIRGDGFLFVTEPTWGTALNSEGTRVFGREIHEFHVLGDLGGL